MYFCAFFQNAHFCTFFCTFLGIYFEVRVRAGWHVPPTHTPCGGGYPITLNPGSSINSHFPPNKPGPVIAGDRPLHTPLVSWCFHPTLVFSGLSFIGIFGDVGCGMLWCKAVPTAGGVHAGFSEMRSTWQRRRNEWVIGCGYCQGTLKSKDKCRGTTSLHESKPKENPPKQRNARPTTGWSDLIGPMGGGQP